MRYLKPILLILACVAVSALAAPFAKEFKFTQPDGTEIVLFGEGDEFYAVFETLDGYSVVFNPQTKAYEYAELSSDENSLVSSGLTVGMGHPQSRGLNKHLRIKPEARMKKVRERFQKWDDKMEVSKRWKQKKESRRQIESGKKSSLALADGDGSAPAAADSSMPAPPDYTTAGTKIGLTLLIDFEDDPATVPQESIVDFCNGDNYTGYGNNGSVKKYFQDNSGGLLIYSNVVTVYIRAPHPKSYYNDTSEDCGDQSRLLIIDAIAAMKALPNYGSEILPTFTNLTTDGSGRVVAFNVFFAGARSGVWAYGLWPNSWALSSSVDLGNGKKVYLYQITDIGSSLELATFCHENGHMLCDFPDIYDYDYDSYGGAGSFCLMGNAGDSYNPVQFCAYLKNGAGWAAIADLTSSSSLTASLTASTNRFYRYGKPGVSTEYYLVENRQKTGRDATLKASGIAIWHVDELGNKDNQSTNYNTSHLNYEVSLMQADNLWHFQNHGNSGDLNDLYYSGNSDAGYSNRFTDVSAPSARWWDGTISEVDFRNFSASAATMTFAVAARPSVTLSLSGSPMAEADGVATVTATLSETYIQPVTVYLSFSGTATLNVDYILSETSIVIPADSLSGSITLTAVQDTIYEGDETVVVDIDSVGNAIENGVQQVTATITDDDPEMVVAPSTLMAFIGPYGGVTSPSNQVCAITNLGPGAISWTATSTNSWVVLSATNGTLAGGAATNVMVSANSGSLGEGVYSGSITFSDVTHGDSLTRPVRLTVTMPYVYFFPLDTDPGWARTGEWAFGTPAGLGGTAHGGPDPSSGVTGTNVFGVNLNGDYSIAVGGPWTLTAGPLDFSGYTNVVLNFQRWLNTDSGEYLVPATIDVSSNGTAWARIYFNGWDSVESTSWSNCQYDISSVADRQATVYVRWGYQIIQDGAYAYSGWNIDDIGFAGDSIYSAYTVTFDAQSGTTASPASVIVTNGSTYGTLAITARAGYTFDGWWTDADGTGTQITSATPVSLTEAQTLYAKWTIATTSQGTPYLWLDQYELVAGGDYEAAALADDDEDGFAAWQEYIAGSNPTNAESFFSITNAAPVPGGFVIGWNATSGRVYSVYRATNLLNSFQTLETNIVWPQSIYTDTVFNADSSGFYKLDVQLAP